MLAITVVNAIRFPGLNSMLVEDGMPRNKILWEMSNLVIPGMKQPAVELEMSTSILDVESIAWTQVPNPNINQPRPIPPEIGVSTLQHNSLDRTVTFTRQPIKCHPVGSWKRVGLSTSNLTSTIVFPASFGPSSGVDLVPPYRKRINIPSFIAVIMSVSMYSSENSTLYLSRVYFITQVILLQLVLYQCRLLLLHCQQASPSRSAALFCLPEFNSSGLPAHRSDWTTSSPRPAFSSSLPCISPSRTHAVSTAKQHWFQITSGKILVTLRLLLTILTVLQPPGLYTTEALSTTLSRFNNAPGYPRNYDFRPTELSGSNNYVDVWTRPYLPCMYRFRDDGETSAILADIVIVGIPLRMFRSERGILYNVSILVTDVLKSQEQILFPVRINHLVRVGQFSKHPDPNRCWVDVEDKQKYMFFIRHPDWSGYFEVSQLPLPYNIELYHRVKHILRLGSLRLHMSSLAWTDQLEVDEGGSILLPCRVTGRPSPAVTWFHNETEIRALWRPSAGRGILHISRHLSELKIDNVLPADSGVYTCLAQNYYDQVRESIRVVVHPTPPQQTEPGQRHPEADPCLGYCYQGHCYIVDGMPFCRCNRNYLGMRCELYFPDSWRARRRRFRHPSRSGRARRRKKRLS